MLLLFLFSCNKNNVVVSEKGAIDIVLNIYYQASKGLDNREQFLISKINYINDEIVEIVPSYAIQEMTDSIYYIKSKDSIYYTSPNPLVPNGTIFQSMMEEQKAKKITKKRTGAVWIDKEIPEYHKRKELKDTVLYGTRSFSRFSIDSDSAITIFYIHPTDTILPYSLNKHVDKDYKGRLERIDSYNRKNDVFTTMWLIPRDTLDTEAKDIFSFNEYLKTKNKN